MKRCLAPVIASLALCALLPTALGQSTPTYTVKDLGVIQGSADSEDYLLGPTPELPPGTKAPGAVTVNGVERAVVRTGDKTEFIEPDTSRATAVNARGQVVGSIGKRPKPGLWESGKRQDLALPPDADYGTPSAVNGSGVAVGGCHRLLKTTPYSLNVLCVFGKEQTQELPTFGLGGYAEAINDKSDVVSYRYENPDQQFGDFGITKTGTTQAALWNGGRLRDLIDPLGRRPPDPDDPMARRGSRAYAINNAGVAVGEWYGRAVLWNGPVGQDLNALLLSRPYPAWLLTSARRIDDQGRIITAARETLSHGRRFEAAHWLLLTPNAPLKAPPPSPR